jgi:hypothetical protein
MFYNTFILFFELFMCKVLGFFFYKKILGLGLEFESD